MVVVPKKSGEVHICVDLKSLNSNVLREVHPLPAVDETLAQLTGAAIYSKLNANGGFWQIPLAATSRHLRLSALLVIVIISMNCHLA